ncbi:MAG: tRNA (adenosine(37)-N6)-threonylcarbamoyltransferase complex transferase subunit TsaD [Pseudomonadales bacterium]|nr:tRNA (adenosine(37)-N6)-threonylcarbamoyltransferase complex transferase subunit TsaD [Pseudomonadales bacterium]
MNQHISKDNIILAVDTSCDDTSASVVKGNVVLSNIIASQTELHRPYGGVFPTVAKQAHKENIDATVKLALKRAKVELKYIDALAVTVGPGLAPALEVGINYIKELAQTTNKPLIAVNHIEGHALSALACRNPKNLSKSIPKKNGEHPEKINFPVLSIVVSGGHTEFILFNEIGKYEIIGSTIDDAAGECLDKIGRMLNLGYPAGPVIEKFAMLGNPKAIEFPLPMTTIKNFDMSFSGLKTFARNYIESTFGKTSLNKQQIYDMCASTQYGVFRHIIYKLNKVLYAYKVSEVWLGGGVAANTKLKQMIRKTLTDFEKNVNAKNKNEGNQKSLVKIIFRTPFTKRLCMDNAAMIGLVAGYKFDRNEFAENSKALERLPRLNVENTNF